jgi:hypothetical protein
VTEVVGNSFEHGTRSVHDEIIVRVYVDEVIPVEVDDRGPGFDAGHPARAGERRCVGMGSLPAHQPVLRVGRRDERRDDHRLVRARSAHRALGTRTNARIAVGVSSAAVERREGPLRRAFVSSPSPRVRSPSRSSS